MKLFYYMRSSSTKSAKIRARIKDGKKELYAVTPLEIPVQYWNQNGKSYRDKIRNRIEFLERDWYKDQLEALADHLKEEYLKLKWEPDSNWLTEEINRFFKPEEKPKQEPNNSEDLSERGTFFQFIKSYIKTSKSRINPNNGKYIAASTLKKYTTCFNLLKSFNENKPLNFEDINQEFYKNFIHYLTSEKEHKLNTIGKQIAVLKGFMNEAAEMNLHNNTSYKSRKFKILAEETDNIYLDESELTILFEHDFTADKKLERVRDLFLIGAWTGCRFGDFTKIKPENIKNGYLHIEQEKTGESVKIPLHPIVDNVLKRYNGKLPRAISNQKFNEYIKDVAQAAKLNKVETIKYTKAGKRVIEIKPKHELISSHTARRSFATNLYKSNFPTIGIMKITGHKTEKAFLKYIKVTADEHAEMLQKHWESYNAKPEENGKA